MVASLICGLAAAVALAQRKPDAVAGEAALAADMAEAARRFASTLTPAQRTKAMFPFAADERQHWHYVPMPRRGIALRELDDAQRAAAYGLLGTAVSRRGLLKASSIMALEEVLRRRENSRERDPGGYFVSLFGDPSPKATWGFRIEGHHLSLNLTLADGTHPVEAPAFFGANPSQVASGVLADTRVLGREEDLGFQLLASLDADQRKAAIYQTTAPADILTGPGSKLAPLPGLSAARMTPAQRAVFDALLDEITGNLPREIADRERGRIAAAAPADLLFTWAGGGSPVQGHYYRLAGPTFLYEFDNTQSGATHIHTVWHARDSAGGDFGVDLLRQHYAEDHKAAAADTAASENPGDDAVRKVWARPIEPFRIAGNIYYVGAANIASYLIATSRGLILLDTGTREMLPHVQANITRLGFQLRDIKILLNSHAHWDHVEGHAAMKRATGAQVMEMAQDAPALSSGKEAVLDDPAVSSGKNPPDGWEPVAVDRVLHDGDDVVLGDVTMHAVLTAGHTPGCTTWTTATKDARRSYSVVFICVPAAAKGIRLSGNKFQPAIADDLARSLRVLGALHPDIYLDGHPEEIYGPVLARLRAGEVPSPLVDPAGYRKYLAECQADLDVRLQRERAGH